MSILDHEQVATFRAQGVTVLRGFYDLERDIHPIQRQIHGVVERIARRHGVRAGTDDRGTFGPFHPDTFDRGYGALLAASRAYASEVYDAVKLLPAFVRLAAHPRNEQLAAELCDVPPSAVGVAGYGIRIDNPGEERFRADWHQEYPTQLRSPHGIVLWSPLVAVDEALGPVRFCVGSHRDGLVPVHLADPDKPEKTGAYGIILEDRDARVARYTVEAPLTGPGDLVVVDFKTIHASGFNRGSRARWSMQVRYFDFDEPTGMKHGWPGPSTPATKSPRLDALHPELIAATKESHR